MAALFVLALALNSVALEVAQRSDGQLQLDVVDAKTGQPMAVRMELKNSRGRAVPLRPSGTAEFGGHFYIDGQVTLPLSIGQYTFDVDAGPEYKPQSGHFEIQRYANDTKRIEMHQFVELAEESWYAGDLDVSRRTADLPLIKRAESLRVIANREPARTASQTGTRSPANSSANITAAPPQSGRPSQENLVLLTPGEGETAKKIARTPYAWDLPVWLATDAIDAIQLIHHHSLASGTLDNEDDGRPRDRSFYPGKSGNARWSETVYYHVLNCGFRVPPTAGSGSGTNDNPLGINRVYAFCGDGFTEARWWEALLAGHVFVTNGPLLRPLVQGQPPGYVFRLAGGETANFEIGLNLATRFPIDYLQIIKNGSVTAEVRLADWKDKKGRLPLVAFDDSGWFLVRVVTSNEKKHEWACTGPYYVERAGERHVSKKSVEFFLEWIRAAEERIRQLPNLEEAARAELLAQQAIARQFFTELLAKANAD